MYYIEGEIRASDVVKLKDLLGKEKILKHLDMKELTALSKRAQFELHEKMGTLLAIDNETKKMTAQTRYFLIAEKFPKIIEALEEETLWGLYPQLEWLFKSLKRYHENLQKSWNTIPFSYPSSQKRQSK